jgi:hypothetical protein
MEAVSSYKAPAKSSRQAAFPCVVNNKRLKAKLVQEPPNILGYEYSLLFSDGTKADIISREGGKWQVEPSSAQPYVNAIEAALRDFVAVNLWPWQMFQITYKDEELLIWVASKRDDEAGQRYSIFFKGSYQFDLRKIRGKWESPSAMSVNPVRIDYPLASIIALKIEQD